MTKTNFFVKQKPLLINPFRKSVYRKYKKTKIHEKWTKMWDLNLKRGVEVGGKLKLLLTGEDLRGILELGTRHGM